MDTVPERCGPKAPQKAPILEAAGEGNGAAAVALLQRCSSATRVARAASLLWMPGVSLSSLPMKKGALRLLFRCVDLS